MATATKTKKRTPKPIKPVVQVVLPYDGLATISEGMGFLKCGRTKIYELINSGLIETVPMGRDKRIKNPSLHQFAKTGNGRLSQ